jgi:DNA-binding response OmpR family regulator
MNCLIVDDSRAMRQLIRRALRQVGIHATVHEANSAEEALSLHQQFPVDLLITDWVMPRTDGLQLIHALRAQGFRGRILVCTSRSGASDRETMGRAGVDAYLTKPFNEETFDRAIHDAGLRGAQP